MNYDYNFWMKKRVHNKNKRTATDKHTIHKDKSTRIKKYNKHF